GSFTTAALSMMAFALGTAPALLALGWASNSLKGKIGRFFFKFSGALVVVLGFWNIQNGLAIAGYPISIPQFNIPSVNLVANTRAVVTETAPMQDGKQVLKMKVGFSGYEPNQFTIRAGTPVLWDIDASQAGGCLGVLVSRKLGIQKLLDPNASNIIEFTPGITGEVAFSCSMGMFRGNLTILPQI
ncbi:sulfite exporter TauE/SafE family protein, partial [Candidatus Uhrbacteria bacterium]|nr:sulfite exporter TauE/SafE family protein [Candidatus Uhrbacteria bacterium]